MLAVSVGPGTALAHVLIADLQVAQTLKSSCMQPFRRRRLNSWALVSLHLYARLSSRSVVCCSRNLLRCSTLCSLRLDFLQHSIQQIFRRPCIMNASLWKKCTSFDTSLRKYRPCQLQSAVSKTLHRSMSVQKSVCSSCSDQKSSG